MNSIDVLIEHNEFEKAEALLESLISKSSTVESSTIVNLILLLIRTPLHDINKALTIADDFLDRYGIIEDVFLLKAYIELTYFGELSKSSVDILVVKQWNKYPDCFSFILAEHYNYNQSNKFQALELYKSISKRNIEFVKCHFHLLRQNENKIAREEYIEYSEKIIKGIKKIIALDDNTSLLHLDAFINENIKGCYLSKPNFDDIFIKLFKLLNTQH